MDERIFCVALNGRPGNLEAILERFAPHLYEVFAAVPPALVGSGRAGAHPLTQERMADQAKAAHSAGVRYTALMNAVSLGGRQFKPEFLSEFRAFLAFAAANGVDALTIADPFLIHQAVEFRRSNGVKLAVYVSSLADITDAVSAQRFEDMGVDRIILHQNVNRDFPALRSILDRVSCEIELYSNTGSLYKCPYRQAHRVLVSHLSTLPPEQLVSPENENWYKAHCVAVRKATPIEIVMAPTIRPEDVAFYQRRGLRFFKLSGRSMPTEWMMTVLQAYVERSWKGNIADLCDTNLGQTMPLISNPSLDGLVQEVAASPGDYRRICEKYLQRTGAIGSGLDI